MEKKLLLFFFKKKCFADVAISKHQNNLYFNSANLEGAPQPANQLLLDASQQLKKKEKYLDHLFFAQFLNSWTLSHQCCHHCRHRPGEHCVLQGQHTLLCHDCQETEPAGQGSRPQCKQNVSQSIRRWVNSLNWSFLLLRWKLLKFWRMGSKLKQLFFFE